MDINLMNFIGNLLFRISMIAIGLVYISLSPIAAVSTQFARKTTMIWLSSIIVCSRIFCGIKVQIHNNHFHHEKGIIVASNHCSAWETFFISQYYNVPVFILKKSLTQIPFIRIFIKKFNMIGIDRDSYSKKNIVNIIKNANATLKLGRNIVIFPQGTRVPIEESYNYTQYPYKSGVAMFASGKRIVTISTDASKCFGKGLFSKKKSGSINIIFNEIMTIESGASKEEIANKIRNSIEVGLKKII